MSAVVASPREARNRPEADSTAQRSRHGFSPEAKRRIIHAVLLVGLLSAHFGVRVYHTTRMPNDHSARHDYSRTYAHSLSLLIGRGFDDLPVAATGASKPVHNFLWLKSERLSSEDLAAFAADVPPTDEDPHYDIYSPLASTRILDVYAAALLWRIFGIKWIVLYVAAAIASTACCGMIYLIGRRLGGGFWPGLLAAAVFFASPTEKFLNGWSIRDSSPLWFATVTFCVLVCLFDRRRSFRQQALGAVILGAVAWLGTGWRMDALIVAPFVACLMTAAVFVHTRRIVPSIACLLLFGIGSAATAVAIGALGSDKQQAKSTGFHMAYYGDAVRSNLLGIENSCQVMWCDMQTVMEARRFAAAANHDVEPLPYISGRYGEVCRQMYFGLIRYNAFRWTAGFPSVCWKTLRGLPDADANDEGWTRYRDSLLDLGRPKGWVLDSQVIEQHVPHLLPILIVFGAALATIAGRQRLLSIGLALFAVYFTGVILAVLPMQKHVAMILLPASVFAGIGFHSLVQLCRRNGWRMIRERVTGQTIARSAVVLASITALWAMTCVITYQISRAERRDYVESIKTMASTGDDAPETLFGTRLFRTTIAPGSGQDNVGYLLTIRAGASPKPLICRHRRIAYKGLRARVLETTHALVPDREQHFFVSCLQGAEYGDQRAYTCTVRCDGDASIVASRRVSLADWDKLAVSTVFAPDDRSPGSPLIREGCTRWTLEALPIYASPEGDPHDIAGRNESVLFAPPAAAKSPSAPLTHLALRDRDSGAWSFLLSHGSNFEVWGPIASWTTAVEWCDVVHGDFDGDGVTDLAGRDGASGVWWVTTPRASAATTSTLGGWSPGDWLYVRSGDFNGDGLIDVVGYAPAAGSWWAAVSDGFLLVNKPWGAWPLERSLEHVQSADLDGDGRDDLLAFDVPQKQWIAFLSRGEGFEPTAWRPPSERTYDLVTTADLDGDQKADLVALSSGTERGDVGLSNGTGGEFHPITFDRPFTSERLVRGDFDGDGRDEVLLWSTTGRFECGQWDDERFAITPYGEVDGAVRFVAVGDFTGAGRDAVAAFLEDGTVRVGVLENGQLHFASWLDRLEVNLESEPLPIRSFAAP